MRVYHRSPRSYRTLSRKHQSWSKRTMWPDCINGSLWMTAISMWIKIWRWIYRWEQHFYEFGRSKWPKSSTRMSFHLLPTSKGRDLITDIQMWLSTICHQVVDSMTSNLRHPRRWTQQLQDGGDSISFYRKYQNMYEHLNSMFKSIQLHINESECTMLIKDFLLQLVQKVLRRTSRYRLSIDF